jgi:hypothetical protein
MLTKLVEAGNDVPEQDRFSETANYTALPKEPIKISKKSTEGAAT